MSRKPHPFFRQLERGQGFVEYGLMILLIAVVAIPVVMILANPSDFRDGAIYRNIYVPILCAVQGRDPETCENIYATAGGAEGGRLGNYGYPTASGSAKNLGESGEATEDLATLEVVALEIKDESAATLPPGAYTFVADVTGGPTSVVFGIFASSDTTSPIDGVTLVGDGEYEVSSVDRFEFDAAEITTEGTYRVVVEAIKDGVVANRETTFEISVEADPNNSANLFGAGFQLFNADTDQFFANITAASTVDPGNWEIVGLTTGGTPASVEIAMTGPVSGTNTVTEAPYALFGHNAGDYTGAALTQGTYNLTLTPYDAAGDAGTPSLASFTVNPPPNPIAVTGFTWITSDDNANQGPLTNGATITVGSPINFEAVTDGDDVDSVKLELLRDGSLQTDAIDNGGGAYTLYPESSGNYSGQTLTPGSYTLTAQPFREDGAIGGFGPVYSVSFTVEAVGPAVESVVLLDTTTNPNTELAVLSNGMVLPDITSIAFTVNANSDTNSVRIQITGDNGYSNTQDENVSPYTSFGDNSGNANGQDLADGTYTITVRPFSARGTSGNEGATYTTTFIASQAVCPSYEVTRINDTGCTSQSPTRVTMRLTVKAACGPDTQVTLGSPLGADIPFQRTTQLEGGASELDEEYRHEVVLDSNAGYDVNTMNQICSGGVPLDVQVVFPDNNTDGYQFGNNLTTLTPR